MNIFATSNGAADINEFWENQELEPEKPDNQEQQQPTTPEPQTPTTPEPPKQPTSTTENQYAHAGIAEDTMMVVAVLALVALAVFANKKVNEYNNI